MILFILTFLQIPSGTVKTVYTYSQKQQVSWVSKTTWIVGALALVWLTWLLIDAYRRARALRRPPRPGHYKLPKRIARIKRELSSQYLRPGFSGNIHAVGIGRLLGDDYCIQVFISDANEELWPGAGALPNSYRSVPVVLIEMPMAGFLSGPAPEETASPSAYPNGIREHQEVIIGGISGANTNLTGQSGTIGYFCTRASKFSRRKEVHLLSNSHVFADLRKTAVDEHDLIMQPSPGEPASNRPIGSLVNFSPLKFDGQLSEPNHIDAAIAKLWGAERHNPLIPFIGSIRGHVEKGDIEVGESARKFGRTTGYTEGTVFSICLDIWIHYDRTGQSAFFRDQFLIEPALPKFTKFVAKGDSGSLVVDENQHAIGLVFGGMAELPESLRELPDSGQNHRTDPADAPKRIESYGVANPISEVLDRMKIELLV
jgi:hypothetical protein